jgi:tRNA pseudouridine32 synthase/23S rRNA pseudouridine746 synthase
MPDEPEKSETPPPSRLYLSTLESPPATILEYVIAHFPRIPADTWHQRVEQGSVTAGDGKPFDEDSPYRHGIFVFYRKEVPSEPEPDEEESIIFRDVDILVADKPHGMQVTPAGNHVNRSLLVRLQRKTGLTALAPMHRLDRETAGVVLFSVRPATRGPYHRLFAEGTLDRNYMAVANVSVAPDRRRWRVENRLEEGDPWFRRRIVDGLKNAITEIELLQLQGGVGLFRIRPKTGKKHQIRVHMASIGFPIVGDPFYPEITDKQDSDPPLQLLANRLAFIDPLSGKSRAFVSTRNLLRRWE